MVEDEAPATVTLELADTRPTMVWLPFLGEIPVMGAGLLVMAFGFLVAMTSNAVWWLAAAAVWWAMSRLCSLDWHAFTRASLWLASSAWCREARTQGGASLAPWPLRPAPMPRLLAAMGIRRIRPRGLP